MTVPLIDEKWQPIKYTLFRDWDHVLLASPLAHVEPIDTTKVKVFGKGAHNRSGIMWRGRLQKGRSAVQVQLLEVEVAASLTLYGGHHGWSRALELRVSPTDASVDAVDDDGHTTRLAFSPRRFGAPIQSTASRPPSVPARLVIEREGDTFTCFVDDGVLWRGSLPFHLPQARVLLRATGDMHNEGRQRYALFGPAHVTGVAPPRTLVGRVVTDDERPLTRASVRVAGDPFAHALTDGAGRFSMAYVPSNALGDDPAADPVSARDALVVGAEGVGFTTASIPEIPLDNGNVDLIVRVEAEPIPRPEYPRPDFDRQSAWWQNLNGVWRLALDREDVGMSKQWANARAPYNHVVRVPFPWTAPMAMGEEAFASSIAYTSPLAGYTGVAWYQRTVRIRDDFPTGDRAVVKFGAVNHRADVFWNGRHVGSHQGGYMPFEVDVGEVAAGTVHMLTVRVVYPNDIDPTDIPVGKQGWWFTHAPGIWQTVWLESRSPVGHVTRLHVRPDVCFDGDEPTEARFHVDFAVDGTWDETVITLHAEGGELVTTHTVAADGDYTVVLPVASPRLWDLHSPHLYTVRARLFDGDVCIDDVSTYAGLREVRTHWAPMFGEDGPDAALEDNSAPYKYVYLNDRPVYVIGILDQGYNPWGVYSYTAYGPIDRPGSIAFDMAAAKELGYNMLRLHVKVNEPLWLYAAAQAGLLVWDEVPNVRGNPNESNRRQWTQLLDGLHARDYNCPAIIIRSLFNESWGIQNVRIDGETQRFLQRMVTIQRQREPHRLVVDNSAAQGYPNRHVDTDINDEHVYVRDWWAWYQRIVDATERIFPGSDYNFHSGTHEADEVGRARQAGEPFIISEFSSGGRKAVALRMHPKVAGFVKINLTDQEWERFSPFTYDRRPKSKPFVDEGMQPLGPHMEHTPDAVIIEAPSTNYIAPGGRTTVPIHVARFTRYDDARDWWLHVTTVVVDGDGQRRSGTEQSFPVTQPPFTVGLATTWTVHRPKDADRVYVFARLEADGAVRARDYVVWKGGD